MQATLASPDLLTSPSPAQRTPSAASRMSSAAAPSFDNPPPTTYTNPMFRRGSGGRSDARESSCSSLDSLPHNIHANAAPASPAMMQLNPLFPMPADSPSGAPSGGSDCAPVKRGAVCRDTAALLGNAPWESCTVLQHVATPVKSASGAADMDTQAESCALHAPPPNADAGHASDLDNVQRSPAMRHERATLQALLALAEEPFQLSRSPTASASQHSDTSPEATSQLRACDVVANGWDDSASREATSAATRAEQTLQRCDAQLSRLAPAQQLGQRLQMQLPLLRAARLMHASGLNKLQRSALT